MFRRQVADTNPYLRRHQYLCNVAALKWLLLASITDYQK